MKSFLFSCFFLVFSIPFCNAQDITSDIVADKSFKIKNRAGSFFINWGYNRSYYRETDIHFKGDGFDFTLKDVDAHDLPEPFRTKIYFNPKKLTIPQFDFRMGYFINHHTSVSIGWDHMKYRLTMGQQVEMDGYIDPELSTFYGRIYDEEFVILNPSLLRLEHSDGLNFVRVAIERQMPFWSSKDDKLRIESLFALSIGAAVPWTDVHFLGTRYANWIHLSGWGTSGIIGMKAHYGNHLYLQYRVQMGYINMPDILFQDAADSRASHDIKFTELSLALGYNFWINKNNKK